MSSMKKRVSESKKGSAGRNAHLKKDLVRGDVGGPPPFGMLERAGGGAGARRRTTARKSSVDRIR